MIKSKQQASIAKRRLAEARREAASRSGLDREVYERFAAEIEDELREYKGIIDGYVKVFQVQSLDDLADALVKARLSRGLSQEGLAQRCGVAEQSVQRDEAGGYESAGLSRVAEVVDALDYEVVGCLRPRTEEGGGLRMSAPSWSAQFARPRTLSYSGQPSHAD